VQLGAITQSLLFNDTTILSLHVLPYMTLTTIDNAVMSDNKFHNHMHSPINAVSNYYYYSHDYHRYFQSLFKSSSFSLVLLRVVWGSKENPPGIWDMGSRSLQAESLPAAQLTVSKQCNDEPVIQLIHRTTDYDTKMTTITTFTHQLHPRRPWQHRIHNL